MSIPAKTSGTAAGVDGLFCVLSEDAKQDDIKSDGDSFTSC